MADDNPYDLSDPVSGGPDFGATNQPFGSLSVPEQKPTEWLSGKFQDALTGMGANPYMAGHLTQGVGDVANLSPLGVLGSAANMIYAKSRGDIGGAAQAGLGMLPGAPAEREIAPMFYSAAKRAIDTAKQSAASPSQWLGMMKNAGVKPEELEHLGLKQFLEQPGPNIRKEDLSKFAEAQAPQINETIKQEQPTSTSQIRLNPLNDQTRPRFQEYSLPGGKNYKEMVLTLPKNPGANDNYTSAHWSEPNVIAHTRFDDRITDGDKKTLHLAELQSDWHQAGRKKGYQTEAAQARLAELEHEVQTLQAPVREMIKDNDYLGFDSAGQAMAAIRQDGPDAWEFNKPEDVELGRRYWEAARRFNLANKMVNEAVPDAPFKKTWHELAMKRMLRYAAENGYDRLSWDVGQTAAQRFNLANHYGELHWQQEGASFLTPEEIDAGTGVLTGYDKNTGQMKVQRVIQKADLPNWIGEDAAKKLFSQEAKEEKFGDVTSRTRSLTGLDVQAGGEGMKGFYDKILPDTVKKLVKKQDGAKVGKTVIEHPQDEKKFQEAMHSGDSAAIGDASAMQKTPAHYVDITPQLRERLMKEGQPMFAAGGGVQGMPDDIEWGPPSGGGIPDDIEWGQPSGMASDVAKSVGTGAVHGMTDFVGAAGNARDFLSRAADFGGEQLGFSPETVKGFKNIAGKTAQTVLPGIGSALQHAPTSAQLNKGVESVTGPLHQAQSTPAKYAESITESLANPGTYIGPGGMLAKGLMGAASGAGAEATGELAQNVTGHDSGLARMVGAAAAGPALGRLAAPQIGAQQQRLLAKGVEMTPGQLAGPSFNRAEDAIAGTPVLGAFVRNARNRSFESLNKAVGNEALAQIGDKLAPKTPAGQAAIGEVGQKLGAAYDQLVPKLHFIPDAQWHQDLSKIGQSAASSMPASQIRQFQRIVGDRLGQNRWVQQVNPNGTSFWGIQGRDFKNIESELTHIAGTYTRSADGAQQLLGEHLGEVIKAMRANLQRSNPAHANELGKINLGWAMFKRMQSAGAAAGNNEGVFSPAQLLGAIKRGDRSADKGMFARGDALMQKFGNDAQAVLPSKLANSGTGERAAMIAAPAVAAHFLHSPWLLGANAAGMALYSSPVVKGLNRLAKPATGFRADYGKAGRGLGTIKPLINTPYGDSENPYSQ